ncbi:MAG TPA: hypothetical protein VJV78_24990, partial [Polyangiales bacterium]|nr:hypothetical protein [Polyangiales bacterium]
MSGSMRFFLSSCAALLSIAVHGCGGGSNAGMDPVNAQPPGAGTTVPAAGGSPTGTGGTGATPAGVGGAGRQAAGTGAGPAGAPA